MAPKKQRNYPFMSQQLDILHPVFKRWFAKQFPKCNKVIVFDKDETLFTTINGRRSCFKHLIKLVLLGLVKLKPQVALVLYTESTIEDMQMDMQLFPEVFEVFDLIVTADNFDQETLQTFVNKGYLNGEPLMLQLRRMSKPVDEIFAHYPVLLIDDYVGTNWIAAKPGVNGIKPYKFHQDNPDNAKKMVQKLVAQIKSLKSIRR